MAEAVEIRDLWKFFGGRAALAGVELVVRGGEIFGLIGPNGAGKTTCFRIVATVLRPSRGLVRVFGHDVVESPGAVRNIISYLPEEAGVYRNLTGLDFLKLTVRLYGGVDGERVMTGVDLSGLGEKIRERMGTYSKGMRRRILLARSLMVNPRLAILDEPTSGLDVEHAVYVRNVIKEYAGRGTTFLISSHNMLEVEYLCTRVAFMDRGRIIEVGEPQGLIQRYGVENLEELFLKVRG
ncbi:MAG: ABC transporter ATP-binding protein [Nitrososphaerota archaeon]